MVRFAILAVAAISVAASAAQPAPAPLTGVDVNRIIPVRVGQLLTIELRRSAGAGPGWRMVPAKGLSSLDDFPVTGDPQRVSFHVRVTMPGDLVLTFVDAHTFGGADQKAQTATFALDASQ